MTFVLPIKPTNSATSIPSFAQSWGNREGVHAVAEAIQRSKRIVVVCGAGISVEAGIPDFRSSEGLYKSLKNENPQEVVSSGRELFDTRVFSNPQNFASFNRMIARLHELSSAGTPTVFHHLLRALDEKSKLLRVYTQNIDALERKAGLELGSPVWPLPVKLKTPKKLLTKAAHLLPPTVFRDSSDLEERHASTSRSPIQVQVGSPLTPSPPSPIRLDISSSEAPLTPSRRTSSPAQTFQAPRCIPVHGVLESMHCVLCSYTALIKAHAAALAEGTPITCPQCAEIEGVRRAVGKRERGVGFLRPSIVLYGEDHREGEIVGECVRRDLTGLGDLQGGERAKAGTRPDLLIVAGTSLQVPGTKRIVKEFAKAVRSGASGSESSPSPSSPVKAAPSKLTPSVTSPSKKQKAAKDAEPPIRTIYVNLDFPAPARDWEGVFDVWVQGDVQVFADIVQQALNKADEVLELVATPASSKKRKRTEPLTPASSNKKRKGMMQPPLLSSSSKKGKRTAALGASSKKRKSTDLSRTPSSSNRGKTPSAASSRRSSPKKSAQKRTEPLDVFSAGSSPLTPPTPTPPSRKRPSKEVVVEIPFRRKGKPPRPVLEDAPTKSVRKEPSMEDLVRTVGLGLRSRRTTASASD